MIFGKYFMHYIRLITVITEQSAWCVCAVVHKRNCIPMSTPGDKCYHSAEYAPDFYKDGVTVPLVNFRFLISIFAHSQVILK